MAEYFDNDWKASAQLGRVYEHDGDWDATHATVHGYVKMDAFKFAYDPNDAYTTLQFIWQGRLYSRTYRRFYSPRYAARLASRFAAEIAQESR